jgi:hypothetical protein
MIPPDFWEPHGRKDIPDSDTDNLYGHSLIPGKNDTKNNRFLSCTLHKQKMHFVAGRKWQIEQQSK